MDHVVKEFHAHGYVHGDLRSPNCIIDERGCCWLILIGAGRNGDHIPGSPTSSDFTRDTSSQCLSNCSLHMNSTLLEYR